MSATVEAVLRQFENVRARLRGADLTDEEADTLEAELHRLEQYVNTRRRPARPSPASATRATGYDDRGGRPW